MSNLRVAVLVDVHNMFFSAKNCGGKINYEKLLTDICAGRTLTRAIAYIVQKAGMEQKSFLTALTKFGYELKVKEQEQKEDPATHKAIFSKASHEIEMTLDAIRQIDRVDCIILVTGNGVYAPLIDYIQNCGCKVELVGFEGATSLELIKKASKFTSIKKDSLIESADEQPQTPVVINDSTPNSLEENEKQPESNASKLGPRAALTQKFGILS